MPPINPWYNMELKGHMTPARNRYLEQEKETLVYHPQKEHRQTFIILHGRGSSAERLANVLLSSLTTKNETLRSVFPHAKIVFPTPPKSQPAVFKRAQPKGATPLMMRQWYDDWLLPRGNPWPRKDPLLPYGLDLVDIEANATEGIHGSCHLIHKILSEEIKLVGKENIVLWGFRQGAAVALSALLTWDGEPFAAIIGMNGYLPLYYRLLEFANGDLSSLEFDDDPYTGPANRDFYWEKEHVDDEDYDWPTKALLYFRFEWYFREKTGKVFKQIPVFLSQGEKDAVAKLGHKAKECLDVLGGNVKLVEYQKLSSREGYSLEMLEDTIEFLRKRLEKRTEA